MGKKLDGQATCPNVPSSAIMVQNLRPWHKLMTASVAKEAWQEEDEDEVPPPADDGDAPDGDADPLRVSSRRNQKRER